MADKTQPQNEGSVQHPYVSTPLRAKSKDAQGIANFFAGMASSFPDLKRRLVMAEVPDTPAEFVSKSVVLAAALTLALETAMLLALSTVIADMAFLFVLAILGLLVLGFLSFNFVMMQPNLKIIRRGKKIDQELLFAGRHILIELRSGLTLFDAMLGVSEEYGEAGREFKKIVDKITLGVPANVALHEVADLAPSPYFKRLILQVSNSLMSGSDLGDSLESVLDQISKEQIIQVKVYGQKLNPIVMFFMLFAVIIPSLGVAFLILLMSFIGSSFASYGASALAGIFIVVAIIQFMFLSMVESSRPSFDMV